MLKRKIGELDASVVAFGAWAIGGWMWGGTEKSESIQAILAALDSGINIIDTAPAYGFGNSETIVGEALKEVKRDDVLIATKCGIIWHEEKGEFFFESNDKGRKGAEGGDIADKKIYRCLKADTIRYEVEQSLKRMQTDYIDLYQTHWQDPTTDIAETMGTLMELKKEGKIRAIGCSNATSEDMQKYMAAGTLAADQEKYSMLDRDMESTNLDFVADNNLAFLAYSPLGQGLLTGKVGPDRVFEEGDQRAFDPRFEVANREKILAMLSDFMPVAEKHKVSLGQLSIAWTFHQRGCSHVLIGARNPQQAKENAVAGGVTLSDEDVSFIRSVIEKYSSELA